MKSLVLLILFSKFALANSSMSDKSLQVAINSLVAVTGATSEQARSIENAANTLKSSQQYKRIEVSQAKKKGASHQFLVCAGADGSLVVLNGEIAICSDLAGRLYKVTGAGLGLGAALGAPVLLPGVAAKIFVIFAVSNSQPVELVRKYNGVKATAALGWVGGQVGVYLSDNDRGQDRRPGTVLISLGYSAGFNFFAGYSAIGIEVF